MKKENPEERMRIYQCLQTVPLPYASEPGDDNFIMILTRQGYHFGGGKPE